MDLNWLQDFICLEDTRSFTQAAHQRHITQPALSRRVRALENWLETALIDRSSYPIQLTAAGETFLPLARQMVTQLHQTRQAIKSDAAARSRVFRVAAPHSIASNHLATRLAELYRDDPNLHVRVFSENLALCLDLLTQGGCEFVLSYCYAPISVTLDPDRFTRVDIGNERMLPVANRAIAELSGWRFPGTPEAPLPFVAYEPDSFLGSVVADIVGAHAGTSTGCTPKRLFLRPRHTDAFAEAVKGMCLGGAGIAWLPESMVESDLRSGNLVRLDTGEWTREMSVALFAPAAHADAAAYEFWRALQRPLALTSKPMEALAP